MVKTFGQKTAINDQMDDGSRDHGEELQHIVDVQKDGDNDQGEATADDGSIQLQQGIKE